MTPGSRGLRAIALLSLIGACGGERRVHPPPEGEWLEWEPSGSAPRKSEDQSENPARDTSDTGEDLDEPKTAKKPARPSIDCSGRDVTRESVCVALSDLGAQKCPAKLPKRAGAKEAGAFEQPSNNVKRDPSLEASDKQCCYAWCGKIPSAKPPVPCKDPEPLFCFEAPTSTQHAAPPPFAECPMGLEKVSKRGRRRAVPRAALSFQATKEERIGAPKACCYQRCK